MWTRAELKARAKANVSRYFWAAFAVSLIFGLLGGSNGGPNINLNLNLNGGYEQGTTGGGNIADQILGGQAAGSLSEIQGAFADLPFNIGSRLFWSIFAGTMVFLLIISLLMGIFVLPAMQVGKNRFYMESRLIGQSAGVGKLFWGFSHHYLNITLTMFLKNLFVGLGMIFCMIPGIYLSYCFHLVPYILAENPDMKPREVLRLSHDMMEGHKMNTFVLGLSFFGWMFLGALACGVGTYFVMPYFEATFAELYAILRLRYTGILNGFGYPDYGPDGYGPAGDYGQADSYGSAGGYGQADSYGSAGGYEQAGSYGPAGGYGYGGPAGGYGPDSAGNSMAGNGWNTNGTQDNSVWIDSEVRDAGGDSTSDGSRDNEDRGSQVKRSEGGPGRGYYLNGVFHPYEEDDAEQK